MTRNVRRRDAPRIAGNAEKEHSCGHPSPHGDNIGTYEHPALVNFMKRKGSRPERVHFEQLTANPNVAIVQYLKKEIAA